jgi:hypothetical protein
MPIVAFIIKLKKSIIYFSLAPIWIINYIVKKVYKVTALAASPTVAANHP